MAGSSNSGVVAGSSVLYSLGVVGAWFYFWQQADGFWEYAWAIVQGLFWPAFMVYQGFEALNS